MYLVIQKAITCSHDCWIKLNVFQTVYYCFICWGNYFSITLFTCRCSVTTKHTSLRKCRSQQNILKLPLLQLFWGNDSFKEDYHIASHANLIIWYMPYKALTGSKMRNTQSSELVLISLQPLFIEIM